eukprot:COSAG02_NODE_11897_length_1633_cov_2.591265_2_plen_116_part_00
MAMRSTISSMLGSMPGSMMRSTVNSMMSSTMRSMISSMLGSMLGCTMRSMISSMLSSTMISSMMSFISMLSSMAMALPSSAHPQDEASQQPQAGSDPSPPSGLILRCLPQTRTFG